MVDHSRRHILVAMTSTAAAGGLAWPTPAASAETVTPSPPSPHVALLSILRGNRRYARDTMAHPRVGAARRGELAYEQHPVAAVLACGDSRVPPELVFDAGLGDLFTVRSAGHVLDDAITGSVEFAVDKLEVPLVFVLGHERCGAVQATVESMASGDEPPGRMATLVRAIAPAVERARGLPGDPVDNAVVINTGMVAEVLRGNPLLAHRIRAGRLAVVGGRYDLDTGIVTVLPRTGVPATPHPT